MPGACLLCCYFNPRSPCGERRKQRRHNRRQKLISIHAPRVGSDAYYAYSTTDTDDFNPRSPCGERRPRSTAGTSCPLISIHAPRVGSDALFLAGTPVDPVFQSTLPVWGATHPCGRCHQGYLDFNPRSPCGERPAVLSVFRNCLIISIHAPRVGSDQGIMDLGYSRQISIHAPRVGSDFQVLPLESIQSDFNPRSPCGERRRDALLLGSDLSISIHAPRVGSDFFSPKNVVEGQGFQSTLPVWGATESEATPTAKAQISIHAPRVGSDR